MRWAGGKSWLLKHLHKRFDMTSFKRLHEPFLGGAAFFLASDRVEEAFLSDLNQELIETYVAVRDELPAVLRALRKHKNTADYYYRLRASAPRTLAGRAARFIYLNQTSFNGIYRVNLEGRYNVPYGHRSKNFFEPGNLKRVGARLQGVNLQARDFAAALDNVKAGDLVFLDPPYTISHNKNGFIKYNQNLFSLEDQHRLAGVVASIKARGAFYVLTNAAHATIAEIFGNGDQRYELSRSSVVGGKKAKRGRTTEFLFTNVDSNA